jgi:hypothetical protein
VSEEQSIGPPMSVCLPAAVFLGEGNLHDLGSFLRNNGESSHCWNTLLHKNYLGSHSYNNDLHQYCASFLHSRHTKYCRRVMAAHQPILHIVGEGGEMVYGIDWPRQLIINRPQPKNVLFDVHNYVTYFKYIHYLK